MGKSEHSIAVQCWTITSWVVWPLVGAILLYAGLRHEENPFGFFQTITAYRIVPIWLATLTAGFFPFLEVVIGFCLIFRILSNGTVPLAAVLTAAFFVVTMSAKVRNLNIDCGCFGGSESPISWFHVIGNLIASIYLFASSRPMAEPRRLDCPI